MDGLFKPEGKFFSWGSFLFDLIWLNLLTILCFLPVISFGASLSALQYALYKRKLGEGPGVTRCFFHSFRDNLRPSIVHTLLLALALYLLWIDWQLILTEKLFIWKLLFALVTFLILGVFTWTVALLSRYQNTVWETIKNAWLLSITKPLRTLALGTLMLLPFLLPLLRLPFLFPVILLGFSSCAWLRILLYAPVFGQLEEKKAND